MHDELLHFPLDRFTPPPSIEQLNQITYGRDHDLYQLDDLAAVPDDGLAQFLTDTGCTAAYQAARPVPVDCPPWCDLEPGHPYDTEPADVSQGLRQHTRAFPTGCRAEVYVAATEYTMGRVGPVWRDPVELYVETDGKPLTPEQGRSVARAVHDAAVLAHQLEQAGDEQ